MEKKLGKSTAQQNPNNFASDERNVINESNLTTRSVP